MNLSKLRNLIILTIAVFSFAVIAIISIFNQDSSNVVAGAVRYFPAFSSIDLVAEKAQNEESMISEQVMMGRGYQLVNVWATWCSVCRSEHEYLAELSTQGIPIIGLNYRDNKRAARQYLAEEGNPYREVIFDPDGNLAIELGVVGTPATYLVDNDGMIIKKYTGRLTESVWKNHFTSYFN